MRNWRAGFAAAASLFVLCALPGPLWPGLAALTGMLLFGGLALAFGRSLAPGHVPLVTRVALRVHAPLTERRRRYTRLVTWAWLLFFAAHWAGSMALLAWPGSGALRLFRLSALPLALALGGIELAVRHVRFRDEPHGSLADMLRALRQAAPGA